MGTQSFRDLINANLKLIRTFCVSLCKWLDGPAAAWVDPLWHFFSPLSVSPLLLPGCINRNRAPAFSLLDPESSYSFCSSGFSLLLQRAESSDESEQAETLGVNNAVDWRLRANSAASQLQEERLSPVFPSSLSGYFNFLPGFLWGWDVERKAKNICFLI